MNQRHYTQGVSLVGRDIARMSAIQIKEEKQRHYGFAQIPRVITRGTYTIYVLIDPRTEAIRYVGISKNPGKRLREHIRCDNVDNPEKDAWMIDLARDGQIPILHIIEYADDRSSASKREMSWIDFYKSRGMPLLNHPKYLKRECEVLA